VRLSRSRDLESRERTGVLAAVLAKRAPGYTGLGFGTKWVIQTAPNRGGSSQLLVVSCPSATSCTAIGNSGGAFGLTLAEGWNGST
jgi:hypothetical protein